MIRVTPTDQTGPCRAGVQSHRPPGAGDGLTPVRPRWLAGQTSLAATQPTPPGARVVSPPPGVCVAMGRYCKVVAPGSGRRIGRAAPAAGSPSVNRARRGACWDHFGRTSAMLAASTLGKTEGRSRLTRSSSRSSAASSGPKSGRTGRCCVATGAGRVTAARPAATAAPVTGGRRCNRPSAAVGACWCTPSAGPPGADKAAGAMARPSAALARAGAGPAG